MRCGFAAKAVAWIVLGWARLARRCTCCCLRCLRRRFAFARFWDLVFIVTSTLEVTAQKGAATRAQLGALDDRPSYSPIATRLVAVGRSNKGNSSASQLPHSTW